jgi:hypothetical protein
MSDAMVCFIFCCPGRSMRSNTSSTRGTRLGYLPGKCTWDMSQERPHGTFPRRERMGHIPGATSWDISQVCASGILPMRWGMRPFFCFLCWGKEIVTVRACVACTYTQIRYMCVCECVCCFKWLKGLVLKTHQHEIDRWGHGSQAGRWLIANKGIDVHAQTKGPVSLEVIAKRKVKHQQHTERKILQSKDLHYFSEALQ